MEVVESAITTTNTIFSSFWSFATGNPVVGILMVISLVGAGVRLFLSVKSKLIRK